MYETCVQNPGQKRLEYMKLNQMAFKYFILDISGIMVPDKRHWWNIQPRPRKKLEFVRRPGPDLPYCIDRQLWRELEKHECFWWNMSLSRQERLNSRPIRTTTFSLFSRVFISSLSARCLYGKNKLLSSLLSAAAFETRHLFCGIHRSIQNLRWAVQDFTAFSLKLKNENMDGL